MKRGAADIALILSIVAFLFSLTAAYFYFSFGENLYTADNQTQTPKEESTPVTPEQKEAVATSTALIKESSVPVFVGSYGSIKKEYLDGVQTAVEKATGAKVTILESAETPVKKSPLYNTARQQFDADTLLKGVETASLPYGTTSRFIFVFDVDMYSSSNPSLKSVWYAGLKGKNVSVISLYGLQKKSDTDLSAADPSLVAVRLQKNALRMMGTNIGVPSSSEASCIMYPSKTLADLDKQGTGYCSPEQSLVNAAFAQ